MLRATVGFHKSLQLIPETQHTNEFTSHQLQQNMPTYITGYMPSKPPMFYYKPSDPIQS